MKKFLQIFSVLLLSCISVVAIGMAKPQLARAEECEWNENAGGSAATCGGGEEAEHRLQIDKTSADGYFYVNKNGTGILLVKSDKVKDADGKAVNKRYKQCTNGVLSSCKDKDIVLDFQQVERFGEPNTKGLCGPQNKLGDKCKDAWGGEITVDQAQADKLDSASAGLTKSGPNECQVAVGALGFFLCPVQDIMQKVLEWVLDLFVQFLTTPALNSSSEGINRAIGGITAIANGFYSIIFLIIIFANFIAIPGLDNYTVKKLLPKLITVIILTQFSFLICSVIIDIGNIAGQTIPSQVLSLYKGAPTDVVVAISEMLNPYRAIVEVLRGVGFTTADAGKIVAIYILAIFQIIAMVVIALISIFYLMFRWFAILLLTIFAPIALAAWVLPNTEKFTKMWITAFMKLTLMYVLVMTVLASAVIAQDVLVSMGGVIPTIMSLFIPLIALALVPKCLKVSGSMLTAAGKMAADTKAGKAASGAAKNAAKKSGQEGKLAELKGKGFGATGKAMGALTGGRAGIGMQAKGAQLKAAPDKARAEKIGSLSFEEQQKLAAQPGKNNKNATAARTALGQKLSELSNKRNLNGKEYEQLASLTGSDGIAGTGTPNPAFNPKIDKDYAGIISNPLYNGGSGGGAPVTPPQPAPGGNTPPPYRGANPQWQAAPGSHGTPPNPTPPTNPPLGPPPPPPGGSSTP